MAAGRHKEAQVGVESKGKQNLRMASRGGCGGRVRGFVRYI